MKIDLNTIIIICGLILIFIYFDRCKPVNDVLRIKGEQAAWEDSAKAIKVRADSLQAINDTLHLQIIVTEAAFELAYARFENSKSNTAEIKKKHEIIRNNIVSLDADESIRLLARRAAALDSLRQRAASRK